MKNDRIRIFAAAVLLAAIVAGGPVDARAQDSTSTFSLPPGASKPSAQGPNIDGEAGVRVPVPPQAGRAQPAVPAPSASPVGTAAEPAAQTRRVAPAPPRSRVAPAETQPPRQPPVVSRDQAAPGPAPQPIASQPAPVEESAAEDNAEATAVRQTPPPVGTADMPESGAGLRNLLVALAILLATGAAFVVPPWLRRRKAASRPDAGAALACVKSSAREQTDSEDATPVEAPPAAGEPDTEPEPAPAMPAPEPALTIPASRIRDPQPLQPPRSAPEPALTVSAASLRARAFSGEPVVSAPPTPSASPVPLPPPPRQPARPGGFVRYDASGLPIVGPPPDGSGKGGA